MQLIDSHCHLDFPDFNDDFSEMLQRADKAGVRQCLTIGTKIRDFPKVLAIAEAHPHIHCSVGIHPHEAETEQHIAYEELITHTHHPKVVGIGETGLDYYYDHSDRDLQKKSFRLHIEAAIETNLPLIVHCREAESDTLSLLEEGAKRGPLKGVIHCFTGTAEMARQSLDLGFYISLSGIVTFKNAKALQEIALTIPDDRLLVETDSPYLAPIPYRGKRNEPAFVYQTAAFLAQIRGQELEKLAQYTSNNFRQLFSKAIL